MAQRSIIISLVVDGRPAWQIKREVPASLCFRMSEDKLNALGDGFVDLLEEVSPELMAQIAKGREEYAAGGGVPAEPTFQKHAKSKGAKK